MNLRQALVWPIVVLQLQAQVAVNKPAGTVLLRPYREATVPPVTLANSDHLHSLIRGGKLYLTLQDAIAVAIENNLDLAVDRYGPLLAEWQLQRAQAGGPLRGVTGGNSLVNQATSGQGVTGSQVSAGLTTSGGNGGGGGGGATVSQIGPVTANLDPVLQNSTAYSHTTAPQANTVQSQTSALVDDRRIVNSFVQQGLLTGGYVQLSVNESYLKENTPTDILNPSHAPTIQIYARHNFLQGFGAGVNGRFIRVAKKGLKSASETFRSQLLNLVTNVVNQYWGLAADLEELKTRQRAVEDAKQFFEDTRQRIALGAVARVDSFRAEGDYTARRQELAIAQSTLRQHENLFKNLLSRNGLADPLIDAAEVVPLDRITVPETDDLPPLRELVQRAITKRPDIALSNLNAETARISVVGTENGLLPQLQAIAAASAAGLAGTAQPQADGSVPDPRYVGGVGTAFSQIFHRSFPSERVGVVFQGTIGNRIAQGDYGIDQLQLQQGELARQRSVNQIVVDISNQMVALRQARSRYSAAVNTRQHNEQLLEKERQKFNLGSTTIDAVSLAQRALVTSQSAEVQALVSYSRAQAGLDQVLGETLEKNHVSVDDALAGRPIK